MFQEKQRLFLHVTKTNILNLHYHNYIQVATFIGCIMFKSEQGCKKLVKFNENNFFCKNRIARKDHSVVCYMTFQRNQSTYVLIMKTIIFAIGKHARLIY